MAATRIALVVLGLTLASTPAFAKGHGGGGHGGGGHSGGHGGGHSSSGHSATGSFGHGSSHGFAASSGWATSHASPGWHGSTSFGSSSSYGSHSFGSSSSSSSSSFGSSHSSSSYSSHASYGSYSPPTVGPTRFHDVVAKPSVNGAPATPVHVQGHVREFATTPSIRTTWVAPRASWRIPAAYDTYFVAYPYYAEESAWVTDWVIVDLLVDEETRIQAVPGDAPTEAPAAPITDQEKEQLRSEVDRDLTRTAAGEADEQRMADAFAEPSHVFVVTDDVVVEDAAHGGRCTLSRADLLRATAPVSRTDSTARVKVVAAKRGSCATSTTVTIEVKELERFERDLIGRVDRAAAEAKATGDQL